MNLDKFTQKAQEAVLDAQRLAGENQQQQIEPEHLLLALLRQADGVAPQVVACWITTRGGSGRRTRRIATLTTIAPSMDAASNAR